MTPRQEVKLIKYLRGEMDRENALIDKWTNKNNNCMRNYHEGRYNSYSEILGYLTGNAIPEED